jgi:hypothetical protein
MEKQYVGIDLHRRRSVIVRRTAAGEALETVRITNDPLALAAELAKAGPERRSVDGSHAFGLSSLSSRQESMYARSRSSSVISLDAGVGSDEPSPTSATKYASARADSVRCRGTCDTSDGPSRRCDGRRRPKA